MTAVTLGLASIGDTKQQLAAAFQGQPQGERIDFASIELLWQMLAPKRWRILQAMAGSGPLAIREVARRVSRDVKAVHGDVHALLAAGVLDRTTTGQVIFPYDRVHVEFTLAAGA